MQIFQITKESKMCYQASKGKGREKGNQKAWSVEHIDYSTSPNTAVITVNLFANDVMVSLGKE